VTREEEDIYRRNPARDIEKLAVALVQSWVGERGSVTDTSAGHGPDFSIAYEDGRVGVGEGAWHQDQQIQAMWAATFRQDVHQTVALPEGSGQWGVGLVAGANIRRLHAELPRLIDALNADGRVHLELYDGWPRDELANAARSLGIQYLSRAATGGRSYALYFFGGGGGVVPDDANVVVDWIDEMLADPDYADTTAKLKDLVADEKHVFVMTGERTPFGADERLRRLREVAPTRAPHLPDWITHLWLTARFHFDQRDVAMWSRSDGWARFPW
jgi:hypothetical protein